MDQLLSAARMFKRWVENVAPGSDVCLVGGLAIQAMGNRRSTKVDYISLVTSHLDVQSLTQFLGC